MSAEVKLRQESACSPVCVQSQKPPARLRFELPTRLNSANTDFLSPGPRVLDNRPLKALLHELKASREGERTLPQETSNWKHGSLLWFDQSVCLPRGR